MHFENTIRGRIRSLLGRTDDGDSSVETPDPPVVRTEDVSETIEHRATYEIERSVELIHFAHGGSLVVEYDNTYSDGEQQYFESVTEIQSAGSGWSIDKTTQLHFGNTVSKVNTMAIAHREPIGTIDVTVSRDCEITKDYDRVVNMHELPVRAVSGGKPIQDLVIDEDGSRYERGWGGSGFEKYQGMVVWNLNYEHNTFTGDTEIDVERSMGDVLQDAVQGGMSNMRAVSANGGVLLPDSEIGNGDDVTQVQALPSSNRQP